MDSQACDGEACPSPTPPRLPGGAFGLTAPLHAYHDCRAELIEPLAEELDDAAVDDLMSETIQAIDELATHHSIEEVYTAKTDVALIGPDFVR